MTPKSEHLVDLILKKLKTYKNKKISLDKDNFNQFILSLFKENWIQDELNLIAIVSLNVDMNMDNFSTLTVVLGIIFIVSLYFLFRVTSSTKN